MRLHALPIAAVLAALLPAAAVAEATTTRIITKQVYGATVTVERGVRVTRALPPTDRVIVNPDGRTPLSLGFVDERHVSHNHYYGQGGAVAADGGVVGYGGWAAGFERGRRHDGHRKLERHPQHGHPQPHHGGGKH